MTQAQIDALPTWSVVQTADGIFWVKVWTLFSGDLFYAIGRELSEYPRKMIERHGTVTLVNR